MNDKMTRHGDGTADFDLGYGVAVTVPCECPDVTHPAAVVQEPDLGREEAPPP